MPCDIQSRQSGWVPEDLKTCRFRRPLGSDRQNLPFPAVHLYRYQIRAFHFRMIASAVFVGPIGDILQRLCRLSFLGGLALTGWYVYWLAFRDPLRDIPGPFLARITRLWKFYLVWKGSAHLDYVKLHDLYGTSELNH